QENDAEIDGNGSEQGEEGLVVENEGMGAIDPYSQRASNPRDENKKGGARRLGAFDEFELRCCDRLDGAQLPGGGEQLVAEDNVPAITGIGRAHRIGAAGTLWIGTDFGGELRETISIGG